MNDRTVSIGITGKIGSGKTTVAKYFESTGYPVLFMDKVGHEVLEKEKIIQALTEEFDSAILNDEKKIDRKILGSIVFSDQKALKFLNETMHPAMNDVAKEWILKNQKNGKLICFIEAAILFEMKMDSFLDKILFVDLDENEIIRRTLIRGKKSEEEIRRILSTQYMKEDQIDYVIDNNGSLKALYEKCREFEDDILSSMKNTRNMI